MKHFLKLAFLLLFIVSCTKKDLKQTTAQTPKDTYVKDNFTKKEVTISMRDGVKLHTTIYTPKDTSKTYPILMQRTPYSSRPYGDGKFKTKIGPNTILMKEGNIVVYQDVRGRWMSEGVYDNMRAYIPNKTPKQADETTDTYDTIDWLVKNVANNNGKVGTWGISYPGHYATVSAIDAHPALKAASPQACIGDFFFDDFHHNGAFLLSYFRAVSLFGTYKDQPTDSAWYSFPKMDTQDQYQFFLDKGPLKNLNEYFQYDKLDVAKTENKDRIDDFFWKEIVEHPNYDETWQSKGIIQHLDKVPSTVATMIVGGLFDAEDLYGPLETYKNIEKNQPNNYNTLVFGPWDHGGWARNKVANKVGNYYFGDSISLKFQKNIETKFFNHFLKGDGSKNSGLPEAYVFDSGKKEWKSYDVWPPKEAKKQSFFLSQNQELTASKKDNSKVDFISDIKRPVPYSEDIKTVFTPRKYMTDDQRFAARRPDVLVYETDVLTDDFTLAGDILAKLKVATTGSAADWIVKVIDVHPADLKNDNKEMQSHLKLSNYHMMVRSEVLRGRFRNSFSNPEPFTPNKKTDVNIKLQDVFHTFKKGHKLQIQVQSTWFPLIDLNPQTYVDNIYKADEKDFKTQTHSVFTDSSIEFTVLKK
ncbi:CocE/NonD family hydrolase [Tenacibaculum sp. AHE15PA]|uniref:CocE/NonD family hydrolase n=1 Tax=unclassified Tenacibaculum TaxID=2635139 RepID=UPI001C5008C0|nr:MULTISPECIES: CocE/NonD family hydrolase [unclassified Tenacibaculum]QXP72616.1 CocE/NonD family hydrolase [Tenacibaculum sp. AHE14PA]QXP76530.1 CocE/NonD family hydrolase [Tenacibaculum sp. AHE15PA]